MLIKTINCLGVNIYYNIQNYKLINQERKFND